MGGCDVVSEENLMKGNVVPKAQLHVSPIKQLAAYATFADEGYIATPGDCLSLLVSVF